MYLSYTNTLNKTNHFAIIDHMSSSAVTTTEETPSVTTTLMEHVAHSFFYEKINNFLYIASSTIQRFHLETRKWIPLVVNISTIDEPEDGVATGSTIYAMWYDVSTKYMYAVGRDISHFVHRMWIPPVTGDEDELTTTPTTVRRKISKKQWRTFISFPISNFHYKLEIFSKKTHQSTTEHFLARAKTRHDLIPFFFNGKMWQLLRPFNHDEHEHEDQQMLMITHPSNTTTNK